MDFSKFDERTKADRGEWVDMLDPETLEPLMDEGKPAQMLILGQAGNRVQDALHDRAVAGAGKTKEDVVSMKKTHQELVATASIYIGGFRNVEINGEDMSDASNAERVLDLTFPRMEIIDGSAASVGGPRFAMANKPFAVQAIEAGGRQGALLKKG